RFPEVRREETAVQRDGSAGRNILLHPLPAKGPRVFLQKKEVAVKRDAQDLEEGESDGRFFCPSRNARSAPKRLDPPRRPQRGDRNERQHVTGERLSVKRGHQIISREKDR